MLVSGFAGPRDRSGVWILSLATSALRKLRDGAVEGAVLSPDESRIAYFRVSVPEIWIMKVSGEDARMLYRVPPGRSHGERLAWSPDGRRIAFETSNDIGTESAIESYDLETGRAGVIVSDPKVSSEFCWARDGRIIYTRLEDAPNEKSSNLWEVKVDPRTGRTRGAPRRLTNWEGFLFDSLGISIDGRRLFFIRLRHQNNVYLGQLEGNGTRLTQSKRFSFEQWTNWPTGWTRDSRAILFSSDRHGELDLFQQEIDEKEMQALTTGQEQKRDAKPSPDGRWILYLAWPKSQGKIQTGEGQLMRVNVAGGPPEIVFRVAGYSGLGPVQALASLSAEGPPTFRCPLSAHARCVLSEQVLDQLVFTAFDPVEGRKGELTRIAAASVDFWDLSPDGQWIALGKSAETNGHIRLVPLAGQAPREISAGDWTHLQSVAWAADGKSLFVSGFASKGGPLLHVSLEGKTLLLYRGNKYTENPSPSPNGRYLAWGEMVEEGNAWVVDMPR